MRCGSQHAIRLIAAAGLAVWLAAACQRSERAPTATGNDLFADVRDPDRFAIALLPDTQYYALSYPDTFTAQARWIADQVDPLDIRAAIHLGDVTETNSDREWRIADRAMAILDRAVPYTIMAGNHDGVQFGDIASERFNRYFSPARFAGKPWYGGHMGTINDNSFITFSAAGMEFLIVSLSFGTPTEALDWADRLIARPEHRTRRVIVATHAYMDADNTRLLRGEKYAVEHARWTDGEAIWQRLIRRHPNIFLVVSGHVTGGGYLTSEGDHGNQVHQLLVNYQGWANGGDGYLSVLMFSPDADRIYLRTYSPTTGEVHTGRAHRYALPYTMP